MLEKLYLVIIYRCYLKLIVYPEINIYPNCCNITANGSCPGASLSSFIQLYLAAQKRDIHHFTCLAGYPVT